MWKTASKDTSSRDWRKVHPFFQCGYNNLERLSTLIFNNLRILLKEIPKLGDRGQTVSWIKEIKGTIVCLCLHSWASNWIQLEARHLEWRLFLGILGEKISPRGCTNQNRIDLYKTTSNNISFTLLLNAIHNRFVFFP